MNPTPFSPDDEPLAQSLRQFQPSATPLDPAIVFYRMGLEAGRRQRTRSVWPAAAALVLAASLSAVIVGPVGYRLGQAASGRSEPSAPIPEMLPQSEPEPLLVQSEPEPSAEPIAGEMITDEPPGPEQTDVAASTELSPEPNVEEPPTERPADLPVLSWPSLDVAIANWLWGDLLEQPSAAQEYILTRRLTAGHSSVDWINDGVPSSSSSRQRPDSDSTASPNVSRAAPQPKPREPLRASDWKEIVDSQHRLY